MTLNLGDARLPWGSGLQYFFWQHPQWWTVALSGTAGVVMLFHAWQHAGHEVHHWMSFSQELGYWMLMVAAMMLPLVLYSIWLTAIGSLWSRRHLAVAGFVAGFLASWLGLGIIAAGLRELSSTHTYAATALAFTGAIFWQRSPMHQRALVACHRTMPLAPVGWRADRDCLRFGATIGYACICSCWLLMLACALSGHSLFAMAATGVTGAADRHWFGLRWRTARLVTVTIAAYYLVRAIWEMAALPHA
jgi:predicted metal-binding membrane protein